MEQLLWRCCCASFLLHSPPAYSELSFFFNTTSPDFDTSILPSDGTYHGSSPDVNGSRVWLIPDPATDPLRNRSAGRIVYSMSITFLEPSGAFLSFNSNVTFQIITINNEGMAFFVAEDPSFPHSSAGGYMGLSNVTLNNTPVAKLEGHRFFAVEYDMYQQTDFKNDPSGGINVNSMESNTNVGRKQSASSLGSCIHTFKNLHL